MKHTSLENFNPKSHKDPIINSPRSLEACRRQGILPNELIVLSLEEIKTLYGDSKLDKGGLELVAQHHEERRVEKIRVLLEERAQIMEDEENGIISFAPNQESRGKSMMSSMHKSTYQSAMGLASDSTLIEREKRTLEKVKQRQEKEIKQLIDHESRMAEIHKVQEDKLELQRQRDRQREDELMRSRKEAEAKKMQQEEEKRRMADEEEERRKEMLAEEYRREQERIAQEKERERQRKIEARRKEEEAKRKHEEFVRETEEKLLEQQRLVDEKKQYMEQKDQIRLQHLREQQMLQKQEAEEKRRYHEEKLKSAKEKNDEIIQLKRLEFEERQARNEEKRKMFERELEYKKHENKMRAEMKSQTIKKVLTENQKLEERKRDEFYYKKALAEERKRELDMIAEQERQKKMFDERQKEARRKEIKDNMEHRLEDRVGGFLNKMAESEEKVARVQREKDEEMRNRHALELIKRHDKQENVQRIARMQEYQKDKLLERINHDTEKANAIKQEKDALLGTRMAIRREMEGSKRSLMEKFDKVKSGKLNPETVSAEFARSVSVMNSPGSRMHSSAHKGTSQQFSSATLNKGSHSAGQNKRGRFHEQNQLSSREEANDSGKKSNPKKEARKVIENLKIKQNHEMLGLLEEEQNKENEREGRLQAIRDQKERDRLEKSFAMDRAKAHARIQQLADSHDEAIRQVMAKYNMKNMY